MASTRSSNEHRGHGPLRSAPSFSVSTDMLGWPRLRGRRSSHRCICSFESLRSDAELEPAWSRTYTRILCKFLEPRKGERKWSCNPNRQFKGRFP